MREKKGSARGGEGEKLRRNRERRGRGPSVELILVAALTHKYQPNQ